MNDPIAIELGGDDQAWSAIAPDLPGPSELKAI